MVPPAPPKSAARTAAGRLEVDLSLEHLVPGLDPTRDLRLAVLGCAVVTSLTTCAPFTTSVTVAWPFVP